MIEVKNLTHIYGKHRAVDNISFTVEKGKIYGFLGPNGAGKSTTMNMITGCLSLTEGEIKINGFDIVKEPEKAKSCIGYLPEIPPVYGDMTTYEYIDFVAEVKGVKRGDRKQAVSKALEDTGLTHMKERLIKNLSKGYKQRVGIAQAVVSNPEIIILDEPTVGLDPIQIIEIRSLIKNLAKQHTVIISSHILSEINAVCDNVIIIYKGKILACDSIENLEKKLADKSGVVIKCRGLTEEVLKKVIPDFKVHILKEEEGYTEALVVTEPCTEVCEQIFEAFSKADMKLALMSEVKADLEAVFVEMTEKEEQYGTDI